MDVFEDHEIFAPHSLCWDTRAEFNRQYRPSRDDRRYIVDFSNTNHIDSVGLGLLLQLSEATGGDRTRLYLARAQNNLAELLHAAGLDRVAHFGYPE